MSKNNNYHYVIRYFCFAIFIVLCAGVTVFARTHDSEATAKLAILSESFSDIDIEEIRSLIISGADVNVRNRHCTVSAKSGHIGLEVKT